jgi:hypothetical protein
MCFAMGVIVTAKLITMSEVLGKPGSLRPGIIFKGKVHIKSWYDNSPCNWSITVSPNGWTSDGLSFQWLQNTFDPCTKSRKTGRYRILVLDSHGSHPPPEFDCYCAKNDIILVRMPPCRYHRVFSSQLSAWIRWEINILYFWFRWCLILQRKRESWQRADLLVSIGKLL